MLIKIRYPNTVSALISFVFCSWIVNEFKIYYLKHCSQVIYSIHFTSAFVIFMLNWWWCNWQRSSNLSQLRAGLDFQDRVFDTDTLLQTLFGTFSYVKISHFAWPLLLVCLKSFASCLVVFTLVCISYDYSREY